MKPTTVCLIMTCLSAVFASTSSAGPLDVSATLFGSISGRGGIDQAAYSIGPPVQVDFDPVKAEVGPLTISGGDGVSTGGLSAGVQARHPEERGDPALFAIDMQGSFVASRTPTGAGTFFSAGSMLVGAQAIAEYQDEIMFELEHDDGVPVTMDAFVYLHGFAALEAVATGGIDPHNVVARIGGRFTGTGDAPQIFGAIKNATGAITPISPGTTNILDFNPIFNFSYSFFSGQPFPVALKLEMTGAAEFVDGSAATLSPGFAIASFEAHFGNTLRWGGITRVIDRRTGAEITDYRITSASGFDYTQTFPIPEPGSSVLLLVGVGGLLVRGECVLRKRCRGIN